MSIIRDSIDDILSIDNKAESINVYEKIDVYNKTEIHTVLPNIGLDTTNTTSPIRAGQFAWNQDEGTVDLGLYGAVLQVGQEFLIKVRAGTNLTSGTVVMASGSIGNSGRIVVTAHDGTQANATRILGILTEDIEAEADGFATIIGKVRNINTTGTLVGESWLDGDKLYVKPSDAGYLTKVEPIDTEIKMSVAYVINAHTNGTLYVRVTGFDENHYKNWVTNLLDTKVDKVPGKSLSTEDYTSIEKTKLDAISENANNYSHPSTHDASMITESTTKRFVSDTEKTSWNAKQEPLVSGNNVKTINNETILGAGNISVSGAPAGTIILFASPTVPAGHLKANGALLSRTTYSALFAAIGTTFGIGDGSTTFALPDLRAYFPRGWDDGRGIDTSRVFGSNQADDFKSHNHNVGIGSGSYAGGTVAHIAQFSVANGPFSSGASGGTETRPKNIALLYCIKY